MRKFFAVSRIPEPCACCAHTRRRGPGVRVQSDRDLEWYYCAECVQGLALTLREAKKLPAKKSSPKKAGRKGGAP